MKDLRREKRKLHIRKHVNGTEAKPRVFVFKSNKKLYSGVANDESGKVLIGGSSLRNSKGAEELGKVIAKELKTKKVKEAVFDRSGYRYHGILTVFVESLRKEGIKI